MKTITPPETCGDLETGDILVTACCETCLITKIEAATHYEDAIVATMTVYSRRGVEETTRTFFNRCTFEGCHVIRQEG